MMKTEIYIATHKKTWFPAYEEYIPIEVGSNFREQGLGILRDNIGTNISDLNRNFCELTALYWLWKNSKADVVGLVHYRRYFMKNDDILNSSNFNFSDLKNTIVLPERINLYKQIKFLKFKVSIASHYALCHYKEDWLKIKEVITELYPAYLSSFNKVGNSKEGLSPYNMFISDKRIIDAYCEWLFNILFEVKKKVSINNYDDYQKRIFGFMSERLFNVYIEKHKGDFEIIYLPVKMME